MDINYTFYNRSFADKKAGAIPYCIVQCWDVQSPLEKGGAFGTKFTG